MLHNKDFRIFKPFASSSSEHIFEMFIESDFCMNYIDDGTGENIPTKTVEKIVDDPFNSEIIKNKIFLDLLLTFKNNPSYFDDCKNEEVFMLKSYIRENYEGMIEKFIVEQFKEHGDGVTEREYSVNVCRTSYGHRTITVKALNQKDALEKADEEAVGLEFSESEVEYSFPDGASLIG